MGIVRYIETLESQAAACIFPQVVHLGTHHSHLKGGRLNLLLEIEDLLIETTDHFITVVGISALILFHRLLLYSHWQPSACQYIIEIDFYCRGKRRQMDGEIGQIS